MAWEALVRRTQGRVYGMAYHYLRSAEEARDLAQEVYVKVYGNLDRFDGSDFTPWLLRLTRNACIDQIRRRRARPDVKDSESLDSLELQDTGESAETASVRESERHLLRRAIDRLGELNREIVLLKEIEGLGFAEIAKMLGLPVGTVKSRSNRARLELARKVLELDPSYGRGGAM